VPVAVQVIVRIFVFPAVAVFVHRLGAHAARVLRRRHVQLRLVRHEARDDVEGAAVEDAGDARVLTVAFEQLLDGVEDAFAGHDFARVEAAVDVERRLVLWRAGLLVRDREQPEVAAR
jgi:hypothetical protein